MPLRVNLYMFDDEYKRPAKGYKHPFLPGYEIPKAFILARS